jgi:hypothetical protein
VLLLGLDVACESSFSSAAQPAHQGWNAPSTSSSAVSALTQGE